MLTIALCDDQKIMGEIMEKEVVKISFALSIDFKFLYYATAEALLDSEENYDILLLDLQLNDGNNGIEVGKELRKRGNKAIFIIISGIQTFKGYEIDTFRYLTKPIDSELFAKAVKDALDYRIFHNTKIPFKNGRETFLVNPMNIVYIESFRRKRYIYTSTEKMTTTEKFEDILKKLPPKHFAFPKRATLIHLAHVQQLRGNMGILTNGKTFSLTRAYHSKFVNEFARYHTKVIGGREEHL